MMMKPRFGIIADDLSGAMNIGVEFSGAGMHTFVVQSGKVPPADADVLIFNTETRTNPPEAAYKKTLAAAHALQQYAPLIIVKKLDSLLRGSIGQELAAIIDSFHIEKCLLIAAAPKLNRITMGGYQHIDNHLLETVRHQVDPASTVEGSHVPALLGAQLAQPIELIGIETVRQGSDAVHEKIRQSEAQVLVSDCASQRDLNLVVETAYAAGIRFFAGTYGLGEALARLFYTPRKALLFAVGSLSMAAYQQMLALKDQLPCAHVRVVYTEAFLDESPASFADSYRMQLGTAMHSHEYVLLQLAGLPDEVEQVWQWAALRGLSRAEVSQRIAALLQEIVQPSLSLARGFVATGGATAYSLFSLLDARGLRLDSREILPGTPGAKIAGGALDGCPFVAKPGSQGSDDALVRLARYVDEVSLPSSG